MLIVKILGHCPVQSDIAEGGLSSPAAGCIYAEYKGLYAVLYVLVGKIIRLYKGRKISIEGTEGLGARPFVLHYAKEVNHLIAERVKMLGGLGVYLAHYAAQTLCDKLLQGPACAVAG